MKIIIDIDERDYKTIKRNADSFIYDNSAYDQLVSKVFHSIKDAKEETDNMLYKDLSEYRDMIKKIVDFQNKVTKAIKNNEFCLGLRIGYSDCLNMMNNIINRHKNAGGGDDAAR